MKTIVISIDELSSKAGGYPVLLNFDDGKPDWRESARATPGLIPADLSLASPPPPPTDSNDGKPLQAKNLREIILTEAEASDRLDAVGEYLYRLLLRDEVEKKWKELEHVYSGEAEPGELPQTEGRRTILNIKPKELRMLPWELISDGTLPLFLDFRNPIMRGPLERDVLKGSSQWPLHVLIVVGSADNDPDVNAKEEIESIQEALIKFDTPVEPEILRRPTRPKLVSALKRFRPHVLHFIGHGRKAAGKNVAALVFEESDDELDKGPAWEWTAGMMTLDFRAYQPRFAFINACRSSAEDDSTQNWGITEALIKAGVPAVLGMQADVRGAAAAKFPGELYEALAHDNDLDVALAKARHKVNYVGVQRRDWALATFYLSAAPEKVIDMQPPATLAFRSDINTRFSDITDFVDRVGPRRELWYGVDPPPTSSPKAGNLLLVLGKSESGKTWLLYWFLRSCSWREMNISYVSMKEKTRNKDGSIREGSKDLLDVLRLIISGSQSHLLGRPLPPEAFYEFNAVVNNLLDPSEPNPATIPPGKVVEDKKLNFSGREIDDEEIITILGAFKIALKRATGNRPLIIALDDLGKTEVRKDHFKNYLLPHFIRPIASASEEGLKNVKLIVAIKDDDYDTELGLPEVENLAVKVELDWLAKEELDAFARELCVRKRVPRSVLDKFPEVINLGNKPTVSPGVVQRFLNMWLQL